MVISAPSRAMRMATERPMPELIQFVIRGKQGISRQQTVVGAVTVTREPQTDAVDVRGKMGHKRVKPYSPPVMMTFFFLSFPTPVYS